MSMKIEDFANELNGLINERDKLKIKLNEIIERNNKNVDELIKYKLKEWEQKSEKELVQEHISLHCNHCIYHNQGTCQRDKKQIENDAHSLYAPEYIYDNLNSGVNPNKIGFFHDMEDSLKPVIQIKENGEKQIELKCCKDYKWGYD